MAIQPPSDILLDVANAADPATVRAATVRLAALAADPGAADAGFSEALSRAGRAQPGAAPAVPDASRLPSPVGGVHRNAAVGGADAYRKFEAVLLQSFVETMLPKDSELFGDKESAGVYRSMMAEQLANQIANAGGIGLAKSLQNKSPQAAPPAAAPGGGQTGGQVGPALAGPVTS